MVFFLTSSLRVESLTKSFIDLWQSDDGDEEELLDSGCVWVANGESDEPIIADFEIIKKDEENLKKSLVKVTDIR